MVFYARRERFSGVSALVGRAFSLVPLTPNHWTLLSLLFAALAALLVATQNYMYGAFIFLFSAFLDFVDGSVARFRGEASRKGAYIDTIADRYVEFFIVLGIASVSALLPPVLMVPAGFWLLIYLFGAMQTTYSKAAAKEKELVAGELKGGLMERGERLILLFIGLLLASYEPVFLSWIVTILAVLTNISAAQRIAKALRLP